MRKHNLPASWLPRLPMIAIWVFWVVALHLIALLATEWLSYRPSFPYAYTLLPLFGVPQSLYSWANFDGVHYLTIAQKGYVGTGLIQAFFPVWPSLLGLAKQLSNLNLLEMGLLVRLGCSALASYLFWLWLDRTLPKTATAWGWLWWLLFPTAFFGIALYNESLFVTLGIGAWLAAKQQRWWLAGTLAGIASGTRVVGILLMPMLLIELITQTHWRPSLSLTTHLHWMRHQWKKLLAISVAVSGLVMYMWYLSYEFHDPLYFLHLQSEFGAGRQESLVIWPQVIWRSFKILLTARPFDWKYFAYAQEFVMGIGSVLLVLWGWWQQKHTKLTTPLAIYALGCLLMPPLTGTFSSMPRYVLSAWPLWLVLAALSQKYPRWAVLALVISAGLLIINTSLFIQGYWVA